MSCTRVSAHAFCYAANLPAQRESAATPFSRQRVACANGAARERRAARMRAVPRHVEEAGVTAPRHPEHSAAARSMYCAVAQTRDDRCFICGRRNKASSVWLESEKACKRYNGRVREECFRRSVPCTRPQERQRHGNSGMQQGRGRR